MKRILQGAFALLAIVGGNAHADGYLKVTLSEPATKSDKQVGKVVFTMTNEGDDILKIPRIHTPFAKARGRLPNPQFRIVDAKGVLIAYIGQNIKVISSDDDRTDNDTYIRLAPHEAMSKIVDLSKDYALNNGPYAVTFAIYATRDLIDEDALGTPASMLPKLRVIRSNTLNIWVNSSLLNMPTGKLRMNAEATVASSGSAFPPFPQCTDKESEAIENARVKASEMSVDAHDYVERNADSLGHFTPTARYRTWFGDDGVVTAAQLVDAADGGYNDPHVASLKRIDYVWMAIASGGHLMSYYCDPCDGFNKETAAHAETANPHTIGICPKFFSLAPDAGPNGQPGTIIHEFSHFPLLYTPPYLNGTADYTYGRENAKALAESDFADARFNGDNFQYFYENPGALQ